MISLKYYFICKKRDRLQITNSSSNIPNWYTTRRTLQV